MVLENFYNLLKKDITGVNGTVKDTGGTSRTVGTTYAFNIADIAIKLGTDTTVNASGYKMENDLVLSSGITVSSAAGPKQMVYHVTYTGTYSGSEEKFRCVGLQFKSGVWGSVNVLFTKSLLTTPLILKPGDVFEISVDIVIGSDS